MSLAIPKLKAIPILDAWEVSTMFGATVIRGREPSGRTRIGRLLWQSGRPGHARGFDTPQLVGFGSWATEEVFRLGKPHDARPVGPA